MRAGGKKLLVDVFAAEVTEVLFLNVGKNAVAVSQFLRTSHAAYPQPACNLGAEKLAAVPPDLQYIVEIHPGTASVVPLRSGGKKMRARDLISHSTASSSPTIWVWTGRRCRQSWGKCSGKGFWNLEKITFIYMKRLEACRLQTKIPCQEH